MSTTTPTDPDDYVRENRDTLAKIIKYGTDDFVRALAIAALVEYGDDPDVEQVRRELDRAIAEAGST